MRRRKSPEDLSISELRRLLVEKRKQVRKEHLERFKLSGRAVILASDQESQPLAEIPAPTPEDRSTAQAQAKGRKSKRLLDRLLLAIEVLAVIGLIVLIYTGIRNLKDLNRQFAEALKPAPILPTPASLPVILPSGHTPPNSPAGAQPNEGEIPNHLRAQYQSYGQIPTPTSGPEQATRIEITAIGVDAPVVQGDGWDQLKKGVAQYLGSASPGQPGNMVLSAHNDVFGEIFRDLDQLEQGDLVMVHTENDAFTYIVTGSQIVDPTAVEVMASTPDPTLTLISCYPYLVDTQRIIVQAILQGWQ